MTASNSDESELGMTTHRIEALTDGIFAIAMTLLVFDTMRIHAEAAVEYALNRK